MSCQRSSSCLRSRRSSCIKRAAVQVGEAKGHHRAATHQAAEQAYLQPKPTEPANKAMQQDACDLMLWHSAKRRVSYFSAVLHASASLFPLPAVLTARSDKLPPSNQDVGSRAQILAWRICSPCKPPRAASRPSCTPRRPSSGHAQPRPASPQASPGSECRLPRSCAI